MPMPKYVIERNISGAGKMSDADLKAISQNLASFLQTRLGNTMGPTAMRRTTKFFIVSTSVPNERRRRTCRNKEGSCRFGCRDAKVIDPTTAGVASRLEVSSVPQASSAYLDTPARIRCTAQHAQTCVHHCWRSQRGSLCGLSHPRTVGDGPGLIYRRNGRGGDGAAGVTVHVRYCRTCDDRFAGDFPIHGNHQNAEMDGPIFQNQSAGFADLH